MNLLIIGRNGQLGSQLINDASDLNYTVIAPPRSELDITKVSNNNIKFLQLLRDNKVDVVINTAAYNDVLKCESSLLYPFDVNCFSVKNIAEITNKLDILFITFSTDYVFDGKTRIPYVETDNPHPINMYGISKLSGEYASLIYDNTIVIRTCGLYGLNSTSTKGGRGNFVDNRISDSKTNKSIEIGCDQIVSPTFVNDLSISTLQLIKQHQKSNKKYNLYHLINEGYCTWYEFTKEIYNIMNIDTSITPIDRHGIDETIKRPLFSAMKNIRAKELGIILPHWKDALRRYLKLKYRDD